ncbi:VanZ family protein [Lederbergia sp. NSJ-179]|uniref:VanZ family protein n=1 Tax=Lederbergia sp. NSJ-179 TaxID=2931402 RepID=UPI001FD5F72D|nr:VanZ family protein [Lederbergia sp. NSJ-179]MCJ7842572.1 VanZ family protein [Lederbergia sp. NSJ-179]
MLRFNLIPILLSLIIFIILSFYLYKRKNKTLTYLLFWSIFYFYLVNVVRITQFPLFILEYPFEYNFSDYINLIPTNPFRNGLYTSVLNVILTIPFGFGLPFLIKMNWKKTILLTMLFSLLLESLQLTAHLILPGHNRMVDINDIIFNTLGGIIGYVLYKLFAKVVKIIISKYDIEMNPILSYIQKTVSTD